MIRTKVTVMLWFHLPDLPMVPTDSSLSAVWSLSSFTVLYPVLPLSCPSLQLWQLVMLTNSLSLTFSFLTSQLFPFLQIEFPPVTCLQTWPVAHLQTRLLNTLLSHVPLFFSHLTSAGLPCNTSLPLPLCVSPTLTPPPLSLSPFLLLKSPITLQSGDDIIFTRHMPLYGPENDCVKMVLGSHGAILCNQPHNFVMSNQQDTIYDTDLTTPVRDSRLMCAV